LNLVYDSTTSRLDYTLNADQTARDRITSIWIHAGTAQKPGAARHPLFLAGLAPSGTVLLSSVDRRDLAEGRLMVRVFVRNVRDSAADLPLSFGKPASNN
jgi:hypothetical protein